MSGRLLSLVLAATFLSTPALAATQADVRQATHQLHEEQHLQHRFESAEKKWLRGYEKGKSSIMLSAGKKLIVWVGEALDEVPRQVVKDLRDGEDDSIRAMYAEALLNLRRALRRDGGDGRPAADAQTQVLLAHLHDDLDVRVGIRKARVERIKQEAKAQR